MHGDDRQRFGLWFALFALVLTGGASSPWRLSLIALPMLAFAPPLRLLLPALALVILPSVLEFGLHGSWVAGLGARIHLVSAALLMLSAVVLGLSLRRSSALRRAFSEALPWLALGLTIQAALRLFELIAPAYQYLSGNHLSAFLTFLICPALALRMATKPRVIVISLLLFAVILSGSRWGIFCFIVFGLLMALSVLDGRFRALCAAALVGALLLPWLFFDLIEITKGGLVLSLGQTAFVRPFTGIGPGGAELLSLQFVGRTARLTHIESIVFDWPAVWGWPLAVLMLIALLALALRSKQATTSRSVSRLQELAGIGIVALLCHDLWDFSLTSGALSLALGILIGLCLPSRLGVSPSRVSVAGFMVFSLLSLGAAHHYEPLRMESLNRLDEVPERFGARGFRYFLNQGFRATDPAAKIKAYSRSLGIAPGVRNTWFLLGDVLISEGLTEQGLLAYRRGLQSTQPDWTSPATNVMARLPISMVPRAIGDHLGGARSVALYRSSRSWADLQLVRLLDEQHSDALIRKFYLKGILKPGRPKALLVPELWRLAQKPPLNEGDGQRILRALIEREPRVDGGALLLRMLVKNNAHCFGLGAWPDEELLALQPVAQELQAICRPLLVGHARDLKLMLKLREFAEH
jgi:hypothetical protein